MSVRISVMRGTAFIAVALVNLFLWWGTQVAAQEPLPPPTTREERAQRKEKLETQLKKILDELDELQRAGVPAEGGETPGGAGVVKSRVEPAEPGAAPEMELVDMSIVSTRVQKHPEGISLSATPRSEYDSQPTRHMRESLESLPGVIVRQANGPRDFSISIRGSGVKTTFAIRDLKMYEDGIIQTQSDGLSRMDLHDPWFMKSVEVTRGASSSLYDNYALGGMVQFKTRRGRDINGVESFFQVGSYGFQKYAFAVGQETKNTDIALFASQVAEDGYIDHSGYNTQSLNFNFRFKIDDKQSLYFKAITNWLDTQVPTRLTLSQFASNPRQAGGTVCTSVTNCNNALLLAQRRLDRRTIIGGFYERQLDANTVLTMEADYDVKDINQTFSQITDNVNPNWKHYTDLRHDGHLAGMPLKSYVGFFVNNMEQEGATFANSIDGTGTRGVLRQNSRGTIRNIGGRFRGELEFAPKWTVAAGLGYEQSIVSVQTVNYTSAGAVDTRANADRTFDNWAPEMSLTWKPAEGYKHWVRASTGYAIPGFSNLTTNPFTGLAGTNFNLKPTKNLNLEIGTDSKLAKDLSVQFVGYWIFFKNEIISQVVSSTGGTASINADGSEYRGIELSYDWRPWAGWRFSGAYTHVTGTYTNFKDRFLVNGVPTDFVRDGKLVPNVVRNVLNFKEEYEHPSGLGAWFETSYWDSYFLNNANTVAAPAYWLMNANVHKNFEFKNNPYVRFAKFYFELDNIADKTYVASGNVVADSTADASKTLFFAGYGRAIYGGVTLGF
ncbi:MAG: TonB-dependent receptor [Nitrospira sp.]|nr:TonB-dependent receptor [Nitrospira sp.]